MENGYLSGSTRDLSSDIGKGRKVYVSTYGCQMNVNDSERIYSLLEMVNYVPVQTPEAADLIIINACSIREKPVQKVYSEVGTYRKLKQLNPQLRVGVGGCVGQQEKGNLIKNAPLIDFVFGTNNIDTLPRLLQELDETGKSGLVEARFEHRAPYHVETLVRVPGVSTFVNIMKGCDNFCSFCVVPFTRGREKSRPLSHLIDDVQKLVTRGVKEVTLLGQNVNSYRSECGADFADLLEKLAVETEITRIRFTTSHPKDFNQKLVQVMARNQPKICEYIHLPCQSGNSEILARMNRGYTREQYLEKIDMIKSAIPNAVLSTDIIVGFPGETEEQFHDTVSLMLEVGFESIFAFKYSPRPFTKAARFVDQISEEVKTRRLEELLQAHNKQAFELAKSYEGRTLEVLVEKSETTEGKLSGRSSQNKLVHFLGSKDLVGQLVPVRVTKAFPNVLRGELVT
ncbi:MAG: tRNA (N6-isopentenyl adenosine(37)-C2)-methylthiotransferase MiaB [Bdellovibrionaceae bacterium]|nr:tRNA (N6-isopentenyl adenosine(37)-C2)-methylthiotransferase MiaB [Pseudobdellovibrionaceae bacterium]